MTSLHDRTDVDGATAWAHGLHSGGEHGAGHAGDVGGATGRVPHPRSGRDHGRSSPPPRPGRHRCEEPVDPPTALIPAVESRTAPVDSPTTPIAVETPTTPIALDPRTGPIAVESPTTPIAVETVPIPVAPPTARGLGRPVWFWAAVVASAAFGVRVSGLMTANDLFIDEVTYGNLAALIAEGHLPSIFGVPFFLHPPGGLLPDALMIRLGGISGSAMDRALQLRWAHAALGAVAVALGHAVLRRITRPAAALAAAGVLVFDPFLLRIDTRVLLETSMVFWLLAGLLVLLAGLGAPPGRRRCAADLAAGLLMGLAVFSKDVAAIPIAAMLVLAVLTRTLRPATVLRVVAALPLPYVAYLGVIASRGLLQTWSAEKLTGLARLVGHRQVTGFNMPGAPSLLSRLVAQLSHFGTSYVLIGCCLAAGVVAARAHAPGRRLVGYLAIGAGALGGYAAAAGTLEEQFGYIVVVTSVVAVAAAAAGPLDRPRWRRGVVTAGLVFLALTGILGVRARLITDDGFRQVRGWMEASLPAGSRVGLTGLTAEFALMPHDEWGVWPSLRSLADHDAHYVMTQSATLSQGYGYSSPQLLTWLGVHAEPVYRFTGPTNGDTTVWRLDPVALREAVARGETLPPVTGGYP